jgi:hypothetical protein
MKLSRYSGGKPQRGEDRIGSGALRFAGDPVLHPSESLGGLVDVVTVEIGDGVEQLLDAFIPAARRSRRMGATSRHQGDRARSVVLSHPIAFPNGVAAPTAETSNSASTRDHHLYG